VYQDSALVLIFRITTFIKAGFEHSIANMFFIPIGLGIKHFTRETFWNIIGSSSADYSTFTLGNFSLRNLLLFTIGNIIGGAVGVGVVH
jgi:formate transporter